VLALGVGLAGCPPSAPPPARSGLWPHESEARVAVPGGVVSVAGGTLHVSRRLLEIETRLGPLPIDAVHDSVAGGWRWSFELELRDGVFTDASGASWDVSGLADGEVVPGTDWVRLDAGRMRTRGGLVHAFDAAGRLAAIHWASDDWPRLVFATALVGAEVRVVAIDQCSAPGACEPVYDLGWDGAGRLASVGDRAGRSAELDWDAAGRLVAARDGGDVEAGLPGDRYAWDGATLVGLDTSDGERVAFQHAGGRIAAVVAEGAGSPTWRFAYRSLGDGTSRTTATAPTGERTAFVWDAQRRLLRRTLVELGESTHLAWDGLRVVRREAPDGTAVERAWQAGWLVSESLPGGNVRQYAWNPDGTNRLDPFAGAVLTVSDVLGLVLAVTYDASGRPVALTDGVGDTTGLAWDGVELASITPPAGPVRAFEAYGEHGRPTVVRVGGEVADEPAYDAVGNLLAGRDLSDPLSTAMPGVVERVFDADRNVSTLVLLDEDPIGPDVERTLRIHRRADGRPRRIERPYGGDTEHGYDALGRRIETRERVDGAWQVTSFAWDAAGRAVAMERPNGMGRAWSYDAAGRVATASALRDGLVESVLTSTWQDGRLVATHDSVLDADELYAYDAAGRVERVVHARGESTEVAWDARGRVVGATLRMPDGSVLRTLAMAYDAADREVAVHDGGPGGPELLGREYAGGRLVATRYGNGLERRYGFDEATGRWIDAVTTAADGRWVADTFLGLNGGPSSVAGGLVTRTADPLGLVPDPPLGSAPGEVETHENFVLDAGSGPRPAGLRLRYMDLGGPFDLGSGSYDALGNRLSVHQTLSDTPQNRRFVYNGEHNRLLEIQEDPPGWPHEYETWRTYAWDEAGYATAVDGVPITWNAQGRIAAIEGVASFVWDAAGRPVSRTVMGETTEHWFGGRLEAPAGETPRHLDLGEVRLDLVAGDHRYRHMGPRRNVKFVTDAAGDVVAHHLYAGYGRVATYGPDDDARGFAGGTHAAGFVVLGARILDPEAGRFLSPDPVEQVLDPYAYAWGNPLQLWDPGGLQAEPAPGSPPALATAAEVVGNFLLATAGVLATVPGLPAKVASQVALYLAAAAHSISTALRDEAARKAGPDLSFGTPPSVPNIPVSTFEPEVACFDGFCFFGRPRPPRFGPVGGDGGGGGGGFGVDLGASCTSPATCASAPVASLWIPWLLRRRRRRSTDPRLKSTPQACLHPSQGTEEGRI
jgi:RHS repeat-associated protein